MDILHSSDERLLTSRSEADFVLSLLERALEYIQQECLSEGVACLTLVREQLPSSQAQLISLVDGFIAGYADYQHAQYLLQQVSRQFAAAHTEQQGRVARFAALLTEHLHELDISDSSSPMVAELRDQPALKSDSSAAPQSHPEHGVLPPTLEITCFGRFEVRRQGEPIDLCSSRNGQAILRYLVVQPNHSARGDTLQNLFWPDDEPEVAQNKLHIAISALRRSLNHGYTRSLADSYIVYHKGIYRLNPTISLCTDIDAFLRYYQSGRQRNEGRVQIYEKACNLYTGPFLVEDLYADWSFLQREQLSQIYLTMCRILAEHCFQNQNYEDATKWATTILKENRCDEAAHRQLIQIYLTQGRRNEALQQYQRCERLLREELGVALLPETTALLKLLL